jgi:hypothetical protein
VQIFSGVQEQTRLAALARLGNRGSVASLRPPHVRRIWRRPLSVNSFTSLLRRLPLLKSLPTRAVAVYARALPNSPSTLSGLHVTTVVEHSPGDRKNGCYTQTEARRGLLP